MALGNAMIQAGGQDIATGRKLDERKVWRVGLRDSGVTKLINSGKKFSIDRHGFAVGWTNDEAKMDFSSRTHQYIGVIFNADDLEVTAISGLICDECNGRGRDREGSRCQQCGGARVLL